MKALSSLLVEETIAENPQSVADYKAGKDKAIIPRWPDYEKIAQG